GRPGPHHNRPGLPGRNDHERMGCHRGGGIELRAGRAVVLPCPVRQGVEPRERRCAAGRAPGEGVRRGFPVLAGGGLRLRLVAGTGTGTGARGQLRTGGRLRHRRGQFRHQLPVRAAQLPALGDRRRLPHGAVRAVRFDPGGMALSRAQANRLGAALAALVLVLSATPSAARSAGEASGQGAVPEPSETVPPAPEPEARRWPEPRALHTEPRHLQPMDVFALEWADAPAVSPDRRQTVYVRRGYDRMKDRGRGDLWLLSAD